MALVQMRALAASQQHGAGRFMTAAAESSAARAAGGSPNSVVLRLVLLA
jgi:hypothetical protein